MTYEIPGGVVIFLFYFFICLSCLFCPRQVYILLLQANESLSVDTMEVLVGTRCFVAFVLAFYSISARGWRLLGPLVFFFHA
jgi:hypothetical protein